MVREQQELHGQPSPALKRCPPSFLPHHPLTGEMCPPGTGLAAGYRLCPAAGSGQTQIPAAQDRVLGVSSELPRSCTSPWQQEGLRHRPVPCTAPSPSFAGTRAEPKASFLHQNPSPASPVQPRCLRLAPPAPKEPPCHCCHLVPPGYRLGQRSSRGAELLRPRFGALQHLPELFGLGSVS